jgi:peptide/nickel transport system permease protein
MLGFVNRRIFQAFFTIFGVMIVTFVLFRVMAGDIASAHLGQRATEQAKAQWMHRNGYDRPRLLNVHARLRLTDLTEGPGELLVSDEGDGKAADLLALLPADDPDKAKTLRLGRYVFHLNGSTPIAELSRKGRPPSGVIDLTVSNGSKFSVEVDPEMTAGDLIDRINDNPDNNGKLVKADIAGWTWGQVFDSQFFRHLVEAVTFRSSSLVDGKKLTDIIRERAGKSLALTVPALALTWVIAMVISCVVAYCRDTWVDRLGVFLSVLGMCIPFLAFMIIGQWVVFQVAPKHAYGLFSPVDVYVPVAIMVISGIGGSVRFYRTVLLDEVNRDYVRTARAKGVPLPAILFKHVLKNCMLPILTNLIMAIPFLIMGSLLVETYFGIPGLGDLMISSINGRDEPIMSGLVFLSALIYTGGLLVTDLSYVLFDPRVRLK